MGALASAGNPLEIASSASGAVTDAVTALAAEDPAAAAAVAAEEEAAAAAETRYQRTALVLFAKGF